MNDAPGGPMRADGDEADPGLASPRLDLIAAAILVALSVLVMAAALALPVPGDLRTAPGLLPFLTAASLCVMAVMLGVSAYRRRGTGASAAAQSGPEGEAARAAALALGVGVYIAALHALSFRYGVTLGGVRLILSAFEPVTIIALAAIIHLCWRGPFWISALISVGWTLTLSLVFQLLFVIPLPGGI